MVQLTCNLILRGLMLRFGSCMYVLTSWFSLLLALCTVSQANCTGGTSSEDVSITSNHLRMPGRGLPITSNVRSNHKLWNNPPIVNAIICPKRVTAKNLQYFCIYIQLLQMQVYYSKNKTIQFKITS